MTVLKSILCPHFLGGSYWESAQKMQIAHFECPQAVEFMMQYLCYNYKAF